MEILVIGNEVNLHECREKLGDSHRYQFAGGRAQIGKLLQSVTIVFDFFSGEQSAPLEVYQNFSGIIFFDVSRISLRQIVNLTKTKATCLGFVGLPTFLNREILETSILNQADKAIIQEVCEKLRTKFAVVKDQVGLITARVVCMIINEAYCEIQENIASRADINLAMKLGTNYPFGPFEWCEKIGIKNVYELLRAVYESTRDERYKVCELLREEAEASDTSKVS